MPPRRKSIAITQTDWSKVKSNLQDTANKIFQVLFNRHPDILEHQFINLKHIPRERFVGVAPGDLPQIAKCHAMSVVNKVTEIVGMLNDEEKVAKEMYNLGRDHANRPLTEYSLQAFKEVMIDVLQENLGFGDANRQAWDFEINQVVSMMWTAIENRRRSIAAAQADWAKADRQQVANKIFHTFFLRHPNLLDSQFVNLRDVPRDQLTNVQPNQMHPRARQHALVVVNKITQIMGVLDNAELLEEEMHQLGRDHANRPLTQEGLLNMKNVMVDVVQEVIGFGAETRDAWEYELHAVVSHMWKAIEARRASIAECKSDWNNCDKGTIANKIFSTFFNRHPNYLDTQFPNLRNVPREQLVGCSPNQMSPIATAHAMVVASKIGELVSVLDKAELVDKEMYALGRDHANRPLTEDGLQAMKEVMVDVLQEVMGFGPEKRDAWNYEINSVVTRMWAAIQNRRRAIADAQNDWAGADHQKIANKVFHTLFTRHPDVLANQFINLTDVPRDQLTAVGPNEMHVKARDHAQVVINKITDVVNMLDDDERVEDEMGELGKAHRDRPLTKAGLDAMRGVMVDVLQQELKFGPEGRDAWDYEINTVISRMWKSIEAHRK